MALGSLVVHNIFLIGLIVSQIVTLKLFIDSLIREFLLIEPRGFPSSSVYEVCKSYCGLRMMSIVSWPL